MGAITRRQFITLTALAGLSAVGLASCSGEKPAPASAAANTPTASNASAANTPATANAPAAPPTPTSPAAEPNHEEPPMPKLAITIAGSTFSATIADTPAARSFATMLPLTIRMADLHRNEKYAYLDTTLPAGTDKPSHMEAGQVMLYGSDCLVVFYESFANTYGGYSALATIDNPSGLAEAVGDGAIDITFDIQP